LKSLYFLNLWNSRDLVFQLAILNIKIRFKNTYLGFLWAALEPLLYFLVLYVVFTGIRGTGESFAIYLITGVMLFHIFVRGTSGGLISLISNEGIIKSLNVNKEIFPVASTLAIGLLSLVDLGVFSLLLIIFNFVPSWTIVLLPFVMIILFFLILGLSYILSLFTVFVRDIQLFWSIFAQTLLFISPVFWYVSEVQGILLTIQSINPLGQLIEIAHKLVVLNQIPSLMEWITPIVYAFSIFLIGYITFHKLERKIAEVL